MNMANAMVSSESVFFNKAFLDKSEGGFYPEPLGFQHEYAIV